MAKAPKDEPKPVMYKSRNAEPFFAYQWLGEYKEDTPIWISSRSHVSSTQLHIQTRTGTMGAHIGDWVTQMPDGSAAVIDNALFQANYEPEKQLNPDDDDYEPVVKPHAPLAYAAGHKAPEKSNWETPDEAKANKAAETKAATPPPAPQKPPEQPQAAKPPG